MTMSTLFDPGRLLTVRGQTYTFLRAEPCIRRRDGRPSTFLAWRTRCPECGVEFEMTTSAHSSAIERGYFTRRCPAHRRPGHRVRV